MGKVYIGTSGWQYFHWQPKFYPQDLPQKKWLSYYAKYFATVEVNATFYHQMRPQTFANWRETVGPDFVFSIKGSRFITHIKKLKDCREPVERFFESAKAAGHEFFHPTLSGVKLQSSHSTKVLPSKGVAISVGISKIVARRPLLDVILWQLPPRMKADVERLKQFLEVLPKGFRQAFEFRDKSWLDPKIYSLLKDGNCALVIQDSPYWPKAEIVTADFVYLRFHGRESLYASCYSQAELDEWAEKMKQWLKQGLDVYAYFNNDAEGYAIDNAKTLKKILR